jgi:hypothetical protein
VYSYNFSRDNRYFKQLGTRIFLLIPACFSLTYCVVYSVFFLETIQTVLSGADLYYWFAAGFGESDHLTAPFASFVDVPMMGSMVALSVQFFFVYRIFMLSERRSWWLCVIICLVDSCPNVPERPYHPSRSSPLSARWRHSRRVSL